jgi:hypothetical protein
MMNRILPFALLAVLSAVPARAGQLLVWQYDSLDLCWDMAAKDSVPAARLLAQALTAAGRDVVVRSHLPKDLSSYDAVFVSLGWSRG